jgi:hypothetical protein
VLNNQHNKKTNQAYKDSLNTTKRKQQKHHHYKAIEAATYNQGRKYIPAPARHKSLTARR